MKELSLMAKAGGILNILYGIIIFIIGAFFMIPLFFIDSSSEDDQIVAIVFLVIGIIFFILSALSIIFNILLLRKGYKYKIPAIVFGFLTLNYLGSILLIIAINEPTKPVNDEISPLEVDNQPKESNYDQLLKQGEITEEEYAVLKDNKE